MSEKAGRGFRVKLAGAAHVGGTVGIYRVRPGRRAGPSWIAPPNGRHTRPVIAKVITVDRSKGGKRVANGIANEVRYAAKEGRLYERDPETGQVRETDAERPATEWQFDRFAHHVIVSPNDGAKLTDPNEFARATLDYWESRVGPLQAVWSIEEKPDRAHPEGNRHVHFVIRGEQDGHDLQFSAHMVRRGFRDGAREAATDQLGYMTVMEARDFERQLERGKWEKERDDRNEERTL